MNSTGLIEADHHAAVTALKDAGNDVTMVVIRETIVPTELVCIFYLVGRHSSLEVVCWTSITGLLVRTHSGTSFIINFISLAPALACASLA